MTSAQEDDDQQPDPDARDRTEGPGTSHDSEDAPGGRPVPARQRDSAARAAGADGSDVAHIDPADDDEQDGRPRDVVDAELIAEETAQQLVQIASSSFTGPLPPAEELHKYDDDERERILRMAEAYTTDESARRNDIVTSSTKVAERQQWLIPGLLTLAFVFSLGSYALFQNVYLSGLFLTYPVMQVIGSTVRGSVRARRSKSADEG